MVTKSSNDLIDMIMNLLKDLGVKVIDESEVTRDEEIGRGGFGKVYKGTYDKQVVAIKELMMSLEDKHKDIVNEISNEISFIQKAQHDKLPKFFGVIFTKNGFLNLVFEFIKGSTLLDLYKSLDDKQKLECIMQLCEILDFLHSKKLIHRDIKPANIMVEDGNNVRLIDFGISKIASKTCTFTKTQIGTTAYMAPECYDVDVEADVNISKPITISGKIDVWAVGTLASEIFSGGILPWSQKCKNVMAIEISLVKKRQFPIPDEVKNESARKIIKSCTIIDPSERSKPADVIKLIKSELQI